MSVIYVSLKFWLELTKNRLKSNNVCMMSFSDSFLKFFSANIFILHFSTYCYVWYAPHSMLAAPHRMLAAPNVVLVAPCSMSATSCSVLAQPDSHGNQRRAWCSLSGGGWVGTIHEKFLESDKNHQICGSMREIM